MIHSFTLKGGKIYYFGHWECGKKLLFFYWNLVNKSLITDFIGLLASHANNFPRAKLLTLEARIILKMTVVPLNPLGISEDVMVIFSLLIVTTINL